jgi:hypothetical protein
MGLLPLASQFSLAQLMPLFEAFVASSWLVLLLFPYLGLQLLVLLAQEQRTQVLEALASAFLDLEMPYPEL